MRKLIILVLFFLPINVLAINTSASSAILMDMDTKRILYSQNINSPRSVASISKIMTAVLAIESGKMDEVVTIGNEIDKSYGSGIYIEKGEEIAKANHQICAKFRLTTLLLQIGWGIFFLFLCCGAIGFLK